MISGPVPFGTGICSNCWDQSFPQSRVIFFCFFFLGGGGILLCFCCGLFSFGFCFGREAMIFEDPSMLLISFFRSYSDMLSKFGEISFQEYVTEGISHPVFYGDLVYKLMRVKSETNFVSSGSKIVKRLRRRKYDPVIIERTIDRVFGPSTALYWSFLNHCTLTNKAVQLYDETYRNLLRGDKALILVPSDCKSGLLYSLDLSSLPDGRSIAYSGGYLYIFWYTVFITLHVYVIIFMASPH